MKTTSDLIYLLFSLFVHLLIVLVMLFRIFIFPSERPEFIKAVRVDLVALPDKDPQEGPKGAPPAPPAEAKKEEKPAAKPVEKPVEKPKEDVFVDKKKEKDKAKEDEKKKAAEAEKKEAKEKVKDQQSAALDRLKALQKIKEMKSKKESPPGEGEGQQYKGNVLSEGNSLTGVEKLQHDQYLGKLDSHIKNNWKLPAWLVGKPYSTAVLVKFDEKGLVLDKKIIRSSGNSAFDTEAMQAIANSVPFPEPPEHLVSYFKVRGIELRFPE